MQCALVFCLVVIIFGVVYSSPELCVFEEGRGKIARCGRNYVNYPIDFIPPISQNISVFDSFKQPLKQLPYNAFRNLSSQSSLTKISLQYCQISDVDAGALLNLHSLSLISLSYNEINQIDSKLFSHTKQIEYIYMVYNKIEVVPSGLFENLLLLKEVDFHRNRIHQVENYSFKNTPSLRILTLTNNQIKFMSMLFKDKFDSLTYLFLDGNPWRCNCELRPLYEFLVKIDGLDEDGLICKEPPTLHGRHWNDISGDEFVCRSEDAISTEDSVITTAEPMITTETGHNVPVTVYNVTMTAHDSVMTSTEPVTTTVYNGTTYQPVDTGIPQPPSNRNWIPYTILALVLVCVAAVIIGVVLFKRRSDQRTNGRHMDSGHPMRVQSSAVSGKAI